MLDTAVDAYHVIGRWDETVAISATSGAGVDALLDVLRQRLPVNPPFYPEEEVTQTNARDIAAELIREQVLRHTREEVPHAVAVVVEDYKERPDGMLYVSANVYVERDSQKGIIIGRGAEMLKTIGSAARKEIEAMEDAPVFLDLHVKVRKNWRKKEPNLQKGG
jgi:GTP-binding protein Era